MKTLILQVHGFTFNVDCVDSHAEQKVALKLIYNYLIHSKIMVSAIRFSTFYVNAHSRCTIVKNAVIDGTKLTGTLLGEKVEFTIDNLKCFDIRDSLEVEGIRRKALIDGEMITQDDGDYIAYEDAKKLLERIAELESALA